ncbi:MAG: peptide MFS transporter [Planctomycetota bacterium]
MFTNHPKGLFRLFFIEMWERLAFYTMVGILFLYSTDFEQGGLGLPATTGGEIYGLYLAFVYFTPYLGGLIADRFLGYRRSVLIGGCFFALGFFLMGLVKDQAAFVTGLVCLCIGNGFFKPNISAMVGNLYQAGDPKRDAGFNIFYMGINIGAFVANFLAAVMRNTSGWLWVFRAAGIGMLVGMVILLVSWKALEKADRPPGPQPGDTPFSAILIKILGPAFAVGIIGYFAWSNLPLPPTVVGLVKASTVGFLAGSIPIVLFFMRLPKQGTPDEQPGMKALLPVYLAGATFFMVLHLNGSAMTAWAKDTTDRLQPPIPAFMQEYFAGNTMPSYYDNASAEEPRPNRLMLLPLAESEGFDPVDVVRKIGQKCMDSATLAVLEEKLPGDVRAVTVAEEQGPLYRQLGCDIYPEVVAEEVFGAHGEKKITIRPLKADKLRRVAFERTAGDQKFPVLVVEQKTFDSMYVAYEEKFEKPPTELPPGEFMRSNNPELYQSLNALFVILLTPILVGLFSWMASRNRAISTARKIFLGMVITTLAVLFMALAGYLSEEGARKVSWMWLFGFYLIVTAGELCLSPMALSLITKLSPARFVGLAMGGWFFATAFGNNFSGFLGGLQSAMAPSGFFLIIAAGCAAVALFILALLPKLDAAIKKCGG